MSIAKSKNRETVAKDKIEVVCNGINDTERDINNLICCSGSLVVLRG